MVRRQFTREFKLDIVRDLETRPMAEICREHCLHPSTVSGWRRDYESNPMEAFKGHGRLWKPEAVIARYERLVGELYAENVFLKKMLEKLKVLQAEERRRR